MFQLCQGQKTFQGSPWWRDKGRNPPSLLKKPVLSYSNSSNSFEIHFTLSSRCVKNMAQNLAFLVSRTSLLKKSYVKVIFTLLGEGWRDLWKSPQQRMLTCTKKVLEKLSVSMGFHISFHYVTLLFSKNVISLI